MTIPVETKPLLSGAYPMPKNGSGYSRNGSNNGHKPFLRVRHQSNDWYHWTVEEFYHAADMGFFEEPNRIEIINGQLRVKEMPNLPHMTGTDKTARLFRRLFEPQYVLREEKSLLVAFDGELIPDVSVVVGTVEEYHRRKATSEDVAVLVEIADTSEDYDTTYKAFTYAKAGIRDYWVILVNRRQVWVYRDPSEEGYLARAELSERDSLAPLFAPETVIAIRDLLPDAEDGGTIDTGDNVDVFAVDETDNKMQEVLPTP